MKISLKILIAIVIFSNIPNFAQLDEEDTPNTEQMVFRRKENGKSEENGNLNGNGRGDVRIKAKEKIIEKMVKEAVNYFNQNSIEKSCREFAHNLHWRNGEIFPFVFDIYGNVLVHGDDNKLIWQNLNKARKDFSSDFKEILAASKKGGWVQYKWNNGNKAAYVKLVVKDNLKYIIGAGFFPQSKEYDAENLVKEAVRRFKVHGKSDTFSRMSNPIGIFVKGDLYTFAYDFQGNCLAHGENPAMVGQNFINLKDSNDVLVIRKMIEIAKSKEGKGWYDYVWRNSPKRVYLEKVIDPKTNIPYLVAAGYYPNTNLDTVYAFVARAIRHLKDVGSKQAFSDFTNPVGDYVKGGISIFVYDMEGVCVANGENPEFVNQNLLNLKDPEGKDIVKTMLKIANNEGKGTFTYIHKNASKLTYVEKVDVPDGKFVIGSGFYPDSKSQSVRSLVNRGVDFLNNNENIEAFRAFGDSNREFFQGDVFLFVYTLDGTSLINGTQSNMIWQNYAKVRDERGKNLIDNIISLARAGGGWVTYNSRNAKRKVYTHLLEKESKTLNKKEFFVIGSGYYL